MVGMEEGRAVLEAGGSALDAAEAVVRVVEDNPEDHTVGYGGYPNIVGQVELDAAVMIGATRQAGAVAGLRGVRHPVSVARLVLERLPHVLLVGEGAMRFAAECGAETRDMLTPEADAVYRKGLHRLPDFDPAGPLAEAVSELVVDPDHVTGTVNVIARDGQGRLVTVTSTSGWAWKYPGRAGDTGLIGAGNYCDDRYGAAACTGWGELAIRGALAHSVVQAMKYGHDVAAACHDSLADLPAAAGIPQGLDTPINVIAVDAAGGHAAYSTSPTARYAYWDGDLAEPEARPRTIV
ncbi:MAG: hypothetical protein QOI20_932 [Acidimicrobiaceae bacterium]|jgi:beta-aspartyl-peptidase (threonine type)|nr:hypothetical protein [Acidimicrobiaceae bacterium]